MTPITNSQRVKYRLAGNCFFRIYTESHFIIIYKLNCSCLVVQHNRYWPLGQIDPPSLAAKGLTGTYSHDGKDVFTTRVLITSSVCM